MKLGSGSFGDEHQRKGNSRWKATTEFLVRSTRSIQARGNKKMRTPKKKKKVMLETKILENTIIKLGSLLAIGFGEAGTEIIGQNLGEDNETVNAMIPGRKV